MDLTRSDAVESELNRLIEKRSSREMDPDEREELWQASVRAYTARRRKEMRAAWHSRHAALKGLIAHHEEQAAKLLNTQQEGTA